ncbi:MAG: AAA family ATPase [Clostridia bacterium]|nr:AAA family ATPase [Clostridia bacterium]
MKEFFKKLCSESYAKARRGLFLGIAAVGVVFTLALLFTPFCNLVVEEVAGVREASETALTPLKAFSLFSDELAVQEGTAYIGVGVFAFVLVALAVEAVFALKCVNGFLTNEAKCSKNAKNILVCSSIATGVFFVGGLITATIAKATEGSAQRANNIFPFIVVLIADVAFALVAGMLHWARKELDLEEESEERVEEYREKSKTANKARLELFIYTAILTVLAVCALLTNILTVKFDESMLGMEFETIKISGADLFDRYAALNGGGQLVVFLLLAMLTVLLTTFFLSLIGYLSKSKLYYKLSISTVILSAVCCLLVGLFGKYYQIVQKLNQGMIEDLIDNALGIIVTEQIKYKVTSRSIYFFAASVVVLGVVLFRRPYSKGLAMEENDGELQNVQGKLEITKMPTATGGNGADGTGQPVALADPCPAFTELDEKIPVFQRELAAKRHALFENPTLPKLVQFIVEYARDSRLHLSYTQEDIATFIAGLGTTRLSILQGMSGTGKTSLPKIFSEALLSNCEIVEVESSWRDKNELLGYYNEFSKTYTPKKFTQALYKAKLNPETLTFIVLDEMNLSRIEYYFSDFLSLMENEEDKRELRLLNVGLYRSLDGERIPYRGLTDGHNLKIPPNVWFIGTANRDESTFEISDKVYDRAHTMNFNKRAAKVTFYNEPIPQRYLPVETLTRLFAEAKKAVKFNVDAYPVIGQVEKLLAPYNISFGNRIAMQIESFVSVYCACFAATDAVIHAAVESILLSKVVAKLELKSVENKEQLAAEFEKLNLHKCSEFILKLNED